MDEVVLNIPGFAGLNRERHTNFCFIFIIVYIPNKSAGPMANPPGQLSDKGVIGFFIRACFNNIIIRE